MAYDPSRPPVSTTSESRPLTTKTVIVFVFCALLAIAVFIGQAFWGGGGKESVAEKPLIREPTRPKPKPEEYTSSTPTTHEHIVSAERPTSNPAQNQLQAENERLKTALAAKPSTSKPATAGPKTVAPKPKRPQALISYQRPDADKLTDEPVGAYTLAPGTRISIAFVGATNSDIGGEIELLVTRDIYDTQTMRTPVIPQYAHVMVKYGMKPLKIGDKRIEPEVNMRLIIRGRDPYPMKAYGTDAMGMNGWPGDVDTKFWQNFGAGILSALLKTSAQSVTMVSGGGVASEMVGGIASGGATTTTKHIDPLVNASPTITKAGAERGNLMLAEPLKLPDAY